MLRSWARASGVYRRKERSPHVLKSCNMELGQRLHLNIKLKKCKGPPFSLSLHSDWGLLTHCSVAGPSLAKMPTNSVANKASCWELLIRCSFLSGTTKISLESCLENPTDRGAWRATVHGVAESDTTEATYHTHSIQYTISTAEYLSLCILDWPKHSFRFFHKMLKHSKELFCQPKTIQYTISTALCIHRIQHGSRNYEIDAQKCLSKPERCSFFF